MILPPLALPVMSLCQKFVKCQKFNRQNNRQKFAMPLLQTTRHYYAPLRRGALKSRKGPHISVTLGPGDPIFTVILRPGFKRDPDFL